MNKCVVLIYPYFYENDPVEKLFQPLGISYLGSQLRELSVPVTLVDCTFETFDNVVDHVVSLNPGIIGISIMISTSRSGFNLAKALRERLPETLFMTGGPLPTVYPEHFFPEFQVVFRGEGDGIFPQFCLEWFNEEDKGQFIKNLNPQDYPGIMMEREGAFVASQPIHHPATLLSSLPPPERSGIDHRKYQSFWMDSEGIRPTTIMITRGCPFACDFCSKPVWGSVFRLPDLEGVFLEIQEIQSLGYDQLWIADDSFTLDIEFLEEFCREKIRRGIDISWSCLSRTTGINCKTVALMKQAGCVKVYFGLESGSDDVLRLMNKNTTVQNGIDAVALFASEGIKTSGFFIVGYPGETVETIQATLRHSLNLHLDEVFFNVPFPLPGSALFERVVGLDLKADWEKSSDIRFVYASEFDEKWLRKEIDRTMEIFRRTTDGTSTPEI